VREGSSGSHPPQAIIPAALCIRYFRMYSFTRAPHQRSNTHGTNAFRSAIHVYNLITMYKQTETNLALEYTSGQVSSPSNLDSCSVFTTILMMFPFGSGLEYDECWNVTMRNACMSCDVVYFLRCRPRGSPRSTPSSAPALVVVHVCALGL
jgi:hypothetical protein